MNPVMRLQRDHDLIQRQVRMLEGLLELGEQAWFALRQVCFTLAQHVRHHIESRQRIIDEASAMCPESGLTALAIKQGDERAILSQIHRLFIDSQEQRVAGIKASLQTHLAVLQSQLISEKQALFPVLEKIFNSELACGGRPDEAPSPVSETMTLRRLLDKFPQCESVFDSLFINCTLEQTTCLDELAWRHGLQFEDLVKRLSPLFCESAESYARS